MLKEELAFIKALSNVEVSPLFLKEVKKAVAAGKMKTTLAAHKANTSAGERPSWVGEARTSRDPLLMSAPKRKAEELSGPGCPSEPPRRRPATEHQLLPATATAMCEQSASGNPGHPGWLLRTRLYCLRPSPHLSQVGRSSPQPWVGTRPNPVFRWTQLKGACLRTCPGL